MSADRNERPKPYANICGAESVSGFEENEREGISPDGTDADFPSIDPEEIEYIFS